MKGKMPPWMAEKGMKGAEPKGKAAPKGKAKPKGKAAKKKC
jgi:hypothetical protein